MMELEDALNLELPAYRVERFAKGPEVEYRAHIPGYPQCTGVGASVEEAIRAARHLLTQLRDGQAAVSLGEKHDELEERLREAMRIVVTRALV